MPNSPLPDVAKRKHFIEKQEDAGLINPRG
jgi:hypothetical protein